jgi:hypothetical protein
MVIASMVLLCFFYGFEKVNFEKEVHPKNIFGPFLLWLMVNGCSMVLLWFFYGFEKVDFEKEGHPQNSLRAVSGIKRRRSFIHTLIWPEGDQHPGGR